MKQYLIKKLTYKSHSQSTLNELYQIISLIGICVEKKLTAECYYAQNYISIYVYFDLKGKIIKEINIYEETK